MKKTIKIMKQQQKHSQLANIHHTKSSCAYVKNVTDPSGRTDLRIEDWPEPPCLECPGTLVESLHLAQTYQTYQPKKIKKCLILISICIRRNSRRRCCPCRPFRRPQRRTCCRQDYRCPKQLRTTFRFEVGSHRRRRPSESDTYKNASELPRKKLRRESTTYFLDKIR